MSEALGTQESHEGALTTYNPPKTMKITMTLGATAMAESTEEEKDPTSKPRLLEAKLSKVRMPKNLSSRPGASLRPQSL
jgi:hypothetical protein